MGGLAEGVIRRSSRNYSGGLRYANPPYALVEPFAKPINGMNSN
jgi:hypothetical protein